MVNMLLHHQCVSSVGGRSSDISIVRRLVDAHLSNPLWVCPSSRAVTAAEINVASVQRTRCASSYISCMIAGSRVPTSNLKMNRGVWRLKLSR